MSTISRETVKTSGVWTLQRRDFGNGEYDYLIIADGKMAVNLYVSDLPDFKADRMVYTVEYSPYSRTMDLEEAAQFVEQAQQALVAATEFQQAIDEAESK